MVPTRCMSTWPVKAGVDHGSRAGVPEGIHQRAGAGVGELLPQRQVLVELVGTAVVVGVTEHVRVDRVDADRHTTYPRAASVWPR